ncbi:uncharacterized protein K452DRAFT_150032 [Aplosporella prunicola CBS 121167]|uniref:Uncharacterized protein n=1 Tax=Aplosporella prunicola CBS 121167 TaxID=1176127 RepID=A0A6A6AYC4_9PEZI|nr:uncharacterized protein K452DRAFT_150032 [Aplosporella prunicola CBS 121167]KAF2135984.1 hypothetical protein K452DRAFT_150032 [Aplosporella prunicola CBS 121167]
MSTVGFSVWVLYLSSQHSFELWHVQILLGFKTHTVSSFSFSANRRQPAYRYRHPGTISKNLKCKRASQDHFSALPNPSQPSSTTSAFHPSTNNINPTSNFPAKSRPSGETLHQRSFGGQRHRRHRHTPSRP